MQATDRSATSGVQAILGLTGIAGQSGGVQLTQDRVVRFEIPADFGADHCKVLQRDLQLLTDIAARHPEGFSALHNAAVRNDFAEASRVAQEIGLTEERFNAEGGGFWVYIAAAAVVIGAYAAFGGSSTREPSPGPDHPPPPDTTITDAGVPGG